MAMTINTNIASLNTQRNLAKTQNALNTSLERLSSGLRINSAKDDAAGLAISTRFNAQITGLDQSVRNANDGISLLQTSEGAMQEVTTILQRMREIAVQASNDTYSSSDRASLQGEMDQLYNEIDRISNATQFNGINLLDGTGGTRIFQVGANSGQSISVKLQSVSGSSLGLTMTPLGALNSSDRIASDNSSHSMSIVASSTTTTTTSIDISNVTDAMEMADAINEKTSSTNVTANAFNTYTGATTATGGASTLTINSVAITTANNNGDLVANINKKSEQTGVLATLNDDSTITLSNYNGANITIGGTDVGNAGLTAGTQIGYVALNHADGSAFEVTGDLTFSSAAPTGATVVDRGVSVGTVAKANEVLDLVDSALNKVSENRATMGAVQNRLDSTISNLMNVSENLSAANGRIVDADFAAETANLSKQQILSQAGTAMLAQAKQLPQQVLELLK